SQTMLNKRLRSKKGTFQINVKHQVIVGLCNLPEWRPSFDAGVVDENIQSAERFDRFFHHPLRIGYLSDIRLYRDRAMPELQRLFHCFVGGFRMRDVV